MNDNHLTPDPDDLDDLADPDAGVTVDPAVVGQLRRTLQAVAAATPTEDRTAALLTAIEPSNPPALSEEDDAMHLDPHDQPGAHRRPTWRRPLVLAAAAAVVVAVVGVALDAGRDEAVQVDPAEIDDGPATGWYIPPAGWEIVEVRADFLDVGESAACPCRVMVAAGEGQEPAALVVHETAGPPDEEEGTPVDVGGRQGLIIDAGVPGLVVGSGDRHLVVIASGVDGDAVVEVADAWLDRVDAGDDVVAADLPLPDGMTAGAIVASPARRSMHVVDVTAVESATGRLTYYQLVPAGYYSSLAIDAGAISRRDGRFEVTTTIGDTPLVGLVGGPVDLSVGPSVFAEEGDDLSVAELRAFLSGLRQVSVTQWGAALDSAAVVPEVVQADSLFGPPLVDGPVDG